MHECKNCGSTDIRKSGEYFEEGFQVEYSIYCNECDFRIGTWAYGNWEENGDGPN